MQVFFIIIVVAFIVMSSVAKSNAGKKQHEQQAHEAAQRAKFEQQQAEQARQQANAPRPVMRPTVSGRVSAGAWHCACGADNTVSAAFCTRCGRPRAQAASGSLAYASSEGGGGVGSLGGTSGEGMGSYEGEPSHTPKSSLRHAVKPVTESNHAHTEESMTGGGEPCTEDYDEDIHLNAYSMEGKEHIIPYGLTFSDKDEVVRGMLYSEIFGKPKALRGRGA